MCSYSGSLGFTGLEKTDVVVEGGDRENVSFRKGMHR